MTKIHTSGSKAAARSSVNDPAHQRGFEAALAQLWSGKRHLLDTEELSSAEAQGILELASQFEQLAVDEAPYPVLNKKTVANIFYENSTRTRSSFELAARKLGMTVLNLDVAGSSVTKGENITDTAVTLISMGVDAIVQRHSASGSAHLLARHLGEQVHVINAGDGWHSHPTQALLDLYTISQVRQNLRGAKMTIVGDILHSRVARSNIGLLKKYGVEIHVVGPPALMPAHVEELGVISHTDLREALEGAHFVMALRLQIERQQQGLISGFAEYKKLYQLNHERLKVADKEVRLLHPGPSNRGIEITDDLHDDPAISLVAKQVTNGVYIRMAVLYLLLAELEVH
jgi:aspartate carbamoyltransferase catalytic subunit